MSRTANIFRHGANHACGGSDPIPGICDIGAAATLPDLITGHITTGDLVAYWRMGELSGTMLDYSENPAGLKPLSLAAGAGSPHVSRGVTGGLPAGVDDLACDFAYDQASTAAGTGDYFAANDTSGNRWTFATLAPFTVECLINPTSAWTLSSLGILGTLNPSSGDRGWGLLGSPTGGGVTPFFRRASNSASASATSSAICPYGEWTHLVGTFDGTTQRIFVNGVLTGSVATAVTVEGVPSITVGMVTLLLVGVDRQRNMMGALDEVAIYNAALTPMEILEHASAATGSGSTGRFLFYINGA